MNPKWITVTAIVTLVLSGAVAVLSVAVAAPRNKTTIHFWEPTTVGSVVLQPGDYTVVWDGAGPDVKVSFSQGKETITTVPATLVAAQNPFTSFTTRPQESGAHLLIEIDRPTLELHFEPGNVSSGQ